MINSDRLFGLVAVLGAFAFGASALQVPTSFMSDPVGPKTFPLIIAAASGLCGLVMMIRPDEDPDWPPSRSLISLVICAIVLLIYAYSLKPGGFLLPTAIAASILSYQISENPRFALITGPSLSVGLYVVFKFALGLSLFGLPRWLMG